MSNVNDLLVEIGTEELPPKALSGLSEAFAELLARQLANCGLTFGPVTHFATPRRLAVLVNGLEVRQRDSEVVRRGPAVAAAFDAKGEPTKAAVGFARTCGVDVDELQQETSDKGAWLVFRMIQHGRPTCELVPGLISAALDKLPIPKRMRWGDQDFSFVRPVHWVCALLGDSVVPGAVMGITITGESRGHRFHHPDPVPIPNPQQYCSVLRTAKVEPDFSVRRECIRAQVSDLADSVGGVALVGSDLLDEVTALCEWPVGLLGRFDEEFLAIPAEVLVETMQHHQKYFPVRDSSGKLLSHFVAVANLESMQPELVRAGNERVIRPRFSDARFFWEQDLRVPLANRFVTLEQVVFHQKLGTLADKSRRVIAGCAHIAALLGYDQKAAERAGLLAKCDLVTLMVGEFPGLQGVMGRCYAERQGERASVAQALEDQYLPRFAGDRLPESPCGRVLSVADKIDTLVGIFAAGERPTGVKDPYGLRRAAIGVLRILIETPLALDLRDLLEQSAQRFPADIAAATVVDDAFLYVMDRLRGYYAEKGVDGTLVDAVMASAPTCPSDFDRRLAAVMTFSEMQESASLASANKRIANILRKASESELPDVADVANLSEPSERLLLAELTEIQAGVQELIARSEYEEALRKLAALRPAVDEFFDQVMVMDENPGKRGQRLRLLKEVRNLFTGIADISLISDQRN